MKNGTNRAVLVGELLQGDGPYVAVAEDFLADSCSRCGLEAGTDAYFLAAGFLCSLCTRTVTH